MRSVSRREQFQALVTVVRYRPVLTGLVVGLSVLVAALSGIGVGFILPIVELAQPSSGGAEGATGVILELFLSVYRFFGVPLTVGTAVFGVTVVMALRYGLAFAVGYLRAVLRLGYARHLQVRLFERTLAAQVGYLDDRGSDELINAGVTQARHAGSFIKQATEFLEAALVSLAFASLALYLAPTLTLLTAVALGLVTVLSRRVFESGYDVGERIAAANERLQSSLQAGTQGVREVKIYGLSGELYENFRDAATDYTRAYVSLDGNQEALNKIHSFTTAATVFVLLYLGLVVFSMPLSQLSVFLFAMFRMAPQLSTAHDKFYRAEGDLPHVVRTERFIDSLAAHEEPTGGSTPVPDRVDRVAFDEVAFSYGEDRVLDGVSFAVERGEYVALVGPSGAGKSTIVSLLARLYEPDAGTITVNGTPIDEFDTAAWRSRVAVVRQQPWIFNDTLRYNLTVGKREATDAEVDRACELACVTEFLDDLPEGYETILGDDGVRLSGGQRQRVAIARALLMDAELLVLDEATSDLDTELEERVHAAISESNTQYTTIAIAHRLSTVIDADRIYTFVDGQIVESGNHDDLLEAGGRYAALYQRQVGQVSQ